MSELDTELAALLSRVDTPTVCNAIEVAEGRRGHDRFTRRRPLAANADRAPFFGFARTAQIRASRPSDEPVEQVRQRRMDYYRYMAAGASPRLAVLEDLDGDDAVGAFWGEVNTTVHKGLGVAGVLSNGLARDLDDLAPGFQVLAGGVGPSHAFVHVVAIDVPVTVFGLEVQPGEFVHADQHGAVIIPAELLPEMAAAIGKLQDSEKLILEPARAEGFDYARFEKAWSAFEKARI